MTTEFIPTPIGEVTVPTATWYPERDPRREIRYIDGLVLRLAAREAEAREAEGREAEGGDRGAREDGDERE